MGAKVLVVDDSPLVVRLAQAYLRERFATATAASGPEGVGKAVTERPDLILLDWNMPGASGRETLGALARDERTRNIPVVVMTTDDQVCQLSTSVDHLTKPFDQERLIGKVLERLSAGGAHP